MEPMSRNFFQKTDPFLRNIPVCLNMWVPSRFVHSSVNHNGKIGVRHIKVLGANSTDISRLQTLQNWAAKLIFCASKKNHASPLLRQLHWLPVRDRITFKVMLYVFKCLAGTGPEYLSSCLELYNPTREGLRSASDATRLTVPIIRGWTFKSAADKTFTYTAPNIWNKLPSSVRSAKSVSVFKKGLKSHLFPQM